MNDPDNIYNWRRADERITSSGHIRETHLGQLKKLGVSRVINLALDTHPLALADEALQVSAIGMSYVHIPVDFEHPTEQDFTDFCQTMDNASAFKIHVHCIANFRVTAFLYRYWRDVTGVDEAKARTLMDSVWKPGGVWAKFIGDELSVELPHRTADGKEWK